MELNLERDPTLAGLFGPAEPSMILRGLEAWRRAPIRPGSALLFLDEIQAAPDLLGRLRWFAEELPELPVVAAGSLLEFALQEPSFSMPVGRVEYQHLEPMTFEEFLEAVGEGLLLDLLRSVEPFSLEALSAPLSALAAQRLREYSLVGGMPRAVATWSETGSWLEVERIHQDLLATFRDDFARYAGTIPRARLDRLLLAVPRLLGRKFTYSQVDRSERADALRRGLELLERARLCHRVPATHANGLPLGAEVRPRFFKEILADVGLASSVLGLRPHTLPAPVEARFVNEGGLAEQLVGQGLRALSPSFRLPELFYWARERKGASAELDYLFEHEGAVVPVEVKAGATGSLKSLHLFMALRGLPLALRFHAGPPTSVDVDTTTAAGRARYRLLSLPLYLVAQAPRWLSAPW